MWKSKVLDTLVPGRYLVLLPHCQHGRADGQAVWLESSLPQGRTELLQRV